MRMRMLNLLVRMHTMTVMIIGMHMRFRLGFFSLKNDVDFHCCDRTSLDRSHSD